MQLWNKDVLDRFCHILRRLEGSFFLKLKQFNNCSMLLSSQHKSERSKSQEKTAVSQFSYSCKIHAVLTSVRLKFSQEHHLPQFNVDLYLNSVHCSQQCMKLVCMRSCNMMI